MTYLYSHKSNTERLYSFGEQKKKNVHLEVGKNLATFSISMFSSAHIELHCRFSYIFSLDAIIELIPDQGKLVFIN